jgi:membrane-associated phospholipid phosphatase
LAEYIQTEQHGWSNVLSTIFIHFWFKIIGSSCFILIFFSLYIYLLKHPVYPVTIMPITLVDRLVEFNPWALPAYLSLWLYVSLPPLLMHTKKEIFQYGLEIGCLCLVALAIFYYWPSAVPAANIDWSKYPGVGFLKGMDAAGNACPSLHVSTAVFSAFWLHWHLQSVGLGRGYRLLSACWCGLIIYSTMATKQHVLVDVTAGIMLGYVVAKLFKNNNSC